jgi:hypothetical protein
VNDVPNAPSATICNDLQWPPVAARRVPLRAEAGARALSCRNASACGISNDLQASATTAPGRRAIGTASARGNNRNLQGRVIAHASRWCGAASGRCPLHMALPACSGLFLCSRAASHPSPARDFWQKDQLLAACAPSHTASRALVFSLIFTSELCSAAFVGLCMGRPPHASSAASAASGKLGNELSSARSRCCGFV